METELFRHKCLNCKWVWLSDDYAEEVLPQYVYGEECPICKSKNIDTWKVK